MCPAAGRFEAARPQPRPRSARVSAAGKSVVTAPAAGLHTLPNPCRRRKHLLPTPFALSPAALLARLTGDNGPCSGASCAHPPVGASVVRAQGHLGMPAGPHGVAAQPKSEERARHRPRAPGRQAEWGWYAALHASCSGWVTAAADVAHVVSAAAGQTCWMAIHPHRNHDRAHAHAQAPPATGQLGLAKDALRLFLGALPALECAPPCCCTCVLHMDS